MFLASIKLSSGQTVQRLSSAGGWQAANTQFSSIGEVVSLEEVEGYNFEVVPQNVWMGTYLTTRSCVDCTAEAEVAGRIYYVAPTINYVTANSIQILLGVESTNINYIQ